MSPIVAEAVSGMLEGVIMEDMKDLKKVFVCLRLARFVLINTVNDPEMKAFQRLTDCLLIFIKQLLEILKEDFGMTKYPESLKSEIGSLIHVNTSNLESECVSILLFLTNVEYVESEKTKASSLLKSFSNIDKAFIEGVFKRYLTLLPSDRKGEMEKKLFAKKETRDSSSDREEVVTSRPDLQTLIDSVYYMMKQNIDEEVKTEDGEEEDFPTLCELMPKNCLKIVSCLEPLLTKINRGLEILKVDPQMMTYLNGKRLKTI